MLKTIILSAFILAGTLHAGIARAATEVPFEPKAFAAAQDAGKPILVDIWASWCPTCAKQAPILSQLSADPAFKDLTIFKLDYDSQKEALRALGARSQSTLIAFHGKAERGRSAGDTNAGSIKALVAQTLN